MHFYCLLVKDHKLWSEEQGEPIPSRPVLSGNNCLNMHLSEIMSELLEPISISMSSAEITSTEELTQKFNSLNHHIQSDPEWKNIDILTEMADDFSFKSHSELVTTCGNGQVASRTHAERDIFNFRAGKANEGQALRGHNEFRDIDINNDFDLDDSNLFDPSNSSDVLDSRLVSILEHLGRNKTVDHEEKKMLETMEKQPESKGENSANSKV